MVDRDGLDVRLYQWWIITRTTTRRDGSNAWFQATSTCMQWSGMWWKQPFDIWWLNNVDRLREALILIESTWLSTLSIRVTKTHICIVWDVQDVLVCTYRIERRLMAKWFFPGTSGIAVNLIGPEDKQFMESLKNEGVHIMPLPGKRLTIAFIIIAASHVPI